MKSNQLSERVYLLLIAFILVMNGCSSSAENSIKPEGDKEGDKDIPGNVITELVPERQKLFRNPFMGWALYCDAYNPDMNFWEGFDNIKRPNSSTTYKASDYATHLYIRWPWSAFEKTEGVYAWNNDPYLKLLVDGAKERGLKLAFRVYIDSRDYYTSSTPDFVRVAGADGFWSKSGEKSVWTPYSDDPIFQKKYEAFVSAFAKQFNDEATVEYVDGYGLGRWGEAHSVIYKNNESRDAVFKWIVDLYMAHFTEVPLAINYHRMLGVDKDWGDVADSKSEYFLDYAAKKGYTLRHDAFGMSQYYKEYEKEVVKKYFPQRPIIAENGWWGTGSTIWQTDPNNYKSWADVWKQSLADALEANANIFDLRNADETQSWFQTSFDLVQKFVAEGGYRLYPDKISLPQKMSNNTSIQIEHRWNNLGVGVCPNNISPWNNKYKVAFALLEKNTNKPKYVFVDEKANPAEWLKNNPKSYTLKEDIKGVEKGKYVWGVSIVDTSKNNARGIRIASKKTASAEGWIPLIDVTVE